MASSSLTPAQLASILGRARLLALDVDGTLTDGRVAYLGEEELAVFHVHDGLGLALALQAGLEIAWISGRGSRAVERRARELGVRELHLGAADKARVLAGIQERLDIRPEDTVVMGDDLVDLAMGSRAALFVAPADARAEVRGAAGLVVSARGGAGAVRELCESLLAARGLWRPRIERAGGARATEERPEAAAE